MIKPLHTMILRHNVLILPLHEKILPLNIMMYSQYIIMLATYILMLTLHLMMSPLHTMILLLHIKDINFMLYEIDLWRSIDVLSYIFRYRKIACQLFFKRGCMHGCLWLYNLFLS